MGQRVDQQRSGFVGKRPPFLAGRVTMGLSDLGGAAWRRPRNWENLRCFGAQGVHHGTSSIQMWVFFSQGFGTKEHTFLGVVHYGVLLEEVLA
jgi:hypothetical protein